MRRILIANRGEIARRIQRTCREMGIDSVAVFSDVDADAPFVREADVAVRIGAPTAYLDMDRVLEAAAAVGADAVHPGYGFLAENAAFATRVADAGMIFIGPSPAAIASMGSKVEAKRTVSAAGVPVVPGYQGEDQSDERLIAESDGVGFPLLVKASAGGGGKGMRLVRDAAALPAAIAAARREALGAFGDDTLMLERYVDRPRHIEFQILGDAHGNTVHLFERECSIQRRHQKIIEESPSVALTEELRQEMGAAAVAAAKAIAYTNAGTVEFIQGADGAYYFLEVNTRLQVEHPVTELVCGVDLVREQIRVARGEELGYAQRDLTQTGAALECRLYAEDASTGFLPSTGTLVDFHIPTQEGLRVDSGVETGSVVGVDYDPMLAKLITWGSTRAEATDRMSRALAQASVQGVTTNRAFLRAVLDHPAYRRGELSTHFLTEHDVVAGPEEPDRDRAAVAAVLTAFALRAQGRQRLRGVVPRFRNNPYAPARVEFGPDCSVRYWVRGPDALEVSVGDADAGPVQLISLRGPCLVWEDAHGVRRSARVVRSGRRWYVHQDGVSVTLDESPRYPEPGAETVEGGCVAPMPGKVVQVLVAEGDAVVAGQTLLILEAMKMEQPVTAPDDGVVASVLVSAGEQVEVDAVLLVIE
jgi:acetyl/propionyl-CoA carboxylase alpha subunit